VREWPWKKKGFIGFKYIPHDRGDVFNKLHEIMLKGCYQDSMNGYSQEFASLADLTNQYQQLKLLGILDEGDMEERAAYVVWYANGPGRVYVRDFDWGKRG